MQSAALLRGRVLVVEDDPNTREVVTLALDGAGYEVQLAEHGRAALQILAEWAPHVILLDLAMPELDGWAFREHQLATEAWADIPVVVMTAGENLRRAADRLRARVILPKPFDLNTLLGVVAGLTGRGQSVTAAGAELFSAN